MNAVRVGYLLADLECFEVVALYIGNALAFVHPGSALEVQVKASEIKVDRADDRRLVVRNEVFRVNESGGIFVDFHAVFYELTVVRAGQPGENVVYKSKIKEIIDEWKKNR